MKNRIRYIIGVCSLYIVWLTFDGLLTYFDWFLNFYMKIQHVVLKGLMFFFSIPAQVISANQTAFSYQELLFGNGNSIFFNKQSLGLDYYFILFTVIILFPAKRNDKFVTLVWGWGILFAISIIRILLAVFFSSQFDEFFFPSQFFLRFTSIVAIVLIWAFFVKNYTEEKLESWVLMKS